VKPATPLRPRKPWNAHPASVAALGDSITRGFNACNPFSDCPDVSWATGGRPAVDSLSTRLSTGGHSWNLAESGAHAADLPGQARAAAAHRPAMVTVLIGANDACAASTGAMTTVAAFRRAIGDTLSYLHRTLPGTQILVASIPDLRHLWSVGRANPLESQLWRLGLCPSMLKDAASDSATARARRSAVRDRVMAYNAALGQECARYERCRYDGGAVFDFPFSTGELSKWDWFHPSQAGQAELARILAGVASAAGAA
jgi:lysophospholipase L1-like esterase